MTEVPTPASLGKVQKIMLLVAALAFAVMALFLKGNFSKYSTLEAMAKRSLDPQIALSNGRPTLIEFYADWCEVCQLMAPDMQNLEKTMHKDIDFVFLNVDNPLWNDFLQSYKVAGVPQINFFDRSGSEIGSSIGLRSSEELVEITRLLAEGKDLPDLLGINSQIVSDFKIDNTSLKKRNISPRSHA